MSDNIEPPAKRRLDRWQKGWIIAISVIVGIVALIALPPFAYAMLYWIASIGH